MSIELIFQMIGIALLLSALYLIIGIIPGTDETSVLVPTTIILVSLNLHPLVIMAGFISAVVTLNIADSIPTAITSIPGGVMSTPLVEHSKVFKKAGLTSFGLRTMIIGSLIGIIVAIPVSLGVWALFEIVALQTGVEISNFIKSYSGYIFLAGAILMSVTGKKKLIALASIIPFGLLTAMLRTPQLFPPFANSALGNLILNAPVSMTPFFLSITTGPLIFGLFSLLVPSLFKKMRVDKRVDVLLAKDDKRMSKTPKGMWRKTGITGALGSLLFFLSPVGVTVMLSEFAVRDEKDELTRAIRGASAVDGLSSATYLSGILISLFVFAFPISPAAMGPGKVIFEAGGLFIQSGYAGLNMSKLSLLVPIGIGLAIGVGLTVFLGMKYAHGMTKFVFKHIPQESVLILLFSIIALLSFVEAGAMGVAIVLSVGLFSGFLNKLGVGYGVQFMSLYAGSLFLELLLKVVMV